jgi:hypothetical protein
VRLADLLAARTLGVALDPLHSTRVDAAIEALQLHHDEIEALAASEIVVRQALDALD